MKLPMIAAVLIAALAAGPALADRDGDRGSGKSAQQAAEEARRKTGGRVLTVKPSDGGYRVKVLTPSGEVRYVTIR